MKDKRSDYSALRKQIAACTRIMNMEGLIDYSGHISVRLPHNDGILIQSYDDSRATLEPDRLLVCDLKGNVILGPEKAAPPREVFIHTQILAARPDISAIAHFHPEIATMFTLVDNQNLVPVRNHASRWATGIPVHPDPGHINTTASGSALAETLGVCNAALMRAHGAVVCAESVPSLLIDCVHFEENASALFRAAALGDVTGLSKTEMEQFLARFNRNAHVNKLWKYYAEKAVSADVIPRSWSEALFLSDMLDWSG